LGAVLAAVFVGLVFAATASAEQSWNVTTENFTAANRSLNPVPDKYGHPAVWSLMYGEAGAPGTDALLPRFFSATSIARVCGQEGFYQRGRYTQVYEVPAVFINDGPTVVEGQSRCAPFATFPTQTLFMGPEQSFRGSNDAVARWTAPVSAMITVSGSVHPVDSHITGITWELDQGVTSIVGPVEMTEDSVSSFGPVTIPVMIGESLDLEIGRGSARGGNDSTAVAWTITAPVPLPPTVTGVKPTSGPDTGGTSVTVAGTHFTGASDVKFGSTSAVSFTVNSDESLTAVAPEEVAGSADVRVTTSGGTSPIAAKDKFKFTPTVTGVSPNTGLTTGGATVTVTGTGFEPGTTATTFKFGTTTASGVNCTSTTECTVVSPAHAAGKAYVRATVNKATSPSNGSADQFTYVTA
jgi:hypothetical protein